MKALSPKTDRCGGIALVIVLAFLFLITALVIAFFSSVTTELSGAKGHASEANAKELASSATQTVMGLITVATSGTDVSGKTLAWASQPGMIRSYDTSGNPSAYYKLYSSGTMIVTSGSFNPASDVDPNWNKKNALYTDLNSPVVSGTSVYFPIVDGNNLVDGSTLSPTVPALSASTTCLTYANNGTAAVEGFYVQKPATYNSAVAISGTNNPVPMPTQWIYVLQDGTLISPTGVDATGNIATFSTGAPNSPSTNPIIGRIAFWTDDDTCKVNINTAAGDVWPNTTQAAGTAGNPGSFWDTPRVSSTFEKTYMAQNQPAANEFQRYPGHPATTYLSAVFPNLTSSNIYQLAPRVAQGGSLSGTAIATGTIALDSDRLYSSADELLFSTTSLTNPGTRDTNPPITAATLEPAKFFLTAHSRAPELNLFNQPRIVIWPVSSGSGSAYRTPYDNVFAYCGTLNGSPYYFQRGPNVAGSGCNSPTADLPATSGPGVGRNRDLINYLRNLTSLPIPGFGTKTFLSKYPTDRDQILTEIFDYIRALNAQDTSVPGLTSFATTSSATGGVAGQGQIIPITDTTHADSNTATLRGFGRFPTVREASLVFAGVGQTVTGTNGVTLKSVPPDADQSPSVVIGTGTTRVQAFFCVNVFDPSQGFAICVPNFQISVSGLNTFTWNGVSMGLPATKTVTINRNYNTGAYGGYKGVSSFIEPSSFSVLSGYIDLPTLTGTAASTFPFTSGPVTVKILDSTGANLLQTFTINFPSATFPVPALAPLLQDATVTPNLNTDFRSLKPGFPK